MSDLLACVRDIRRKAIYAWAEKNTELLTRVTEQMLEAARKTEASTAVETGIHYMDDEYDILMSWLTMKGFRVNYGRTDTTIGVSWRELRG